MFYFQTDINKIACYTERMGEKKRQHGRMVRVLLAMEFLFDTRFLSTDLA